MDSWARLLLLLSWCGPLQGRDRLEPSLAQCCEDGRDRGLAAQDCSILPLFSSSYICKTAQEQCCAAVREDMLCLRGVDMAKMQGACETPFFHGELWETEISKSCCDCCMLGLEAPSRGLSCQLEGLSVGGRCRQAAQICCNKNHTEETQPLTTAPELETSPANPTEDPAGEPRGGGGGGCAESNCSQLCVGNGSCACLDGYQLRDDGVDCEDINECLTHRHTCVVGQACINTDGSFRCQREISCGTGYELTDDNMCQDIDECTLGTHNCGAAFVCANTAGSFRCRPKDKCPDGHIQDAIGSCIDINECLALTSPCSPGQTCVNTAGSFFCRRNSVTCGRGYHLTEEGTRCVDVDECGTGDVCHGHACVNMVGTYRCQCRQGFFFNSITKLCEDINECLHNPVLLCAHQCVNTPGSYRCSCSPGFTLAADGRACQDVDECAANPCSQECANVYGSYQCYCRRGYHLSDVDGTTCEDFDECSLATGGHLCSYQCLNVPGSYQCSCPDTGYTLAANGRTCLDIDECAAERHTCSASESCFNVQGGFRCLSQECPANFRPSGPGRCDRVTCEFTRDPAACFSLPLRISFYNITFPTNTPVPADIFRMGPSNSVPGDEMWLDLVSGDEDGFFTTQRQAYGGVISLRRPLVEPRDFLLTVEMRLVRYGNTHLYMAKIAVFVTREQPIRPNGLFPY